jgi:hypothetical protein
MAGKRGKIDLRPRRPPAEGPPATSTRPATSSGASPAKPPSRQGTKALTVHLPEATTKRFALLALELDRQHQSLLEEAVSDLLTKYAPQARGSAA